MLAWAAPAVLPLDFTWTAPDTCPTQAEVVEQLNRAVNAGGKELPPLKARAMVVQDGALWRLELTTEMDGRRGTRLLEADSCEGLARAATLVLALTLGEGLERRRQAAVGARAAPPPPPTEKPPPAPTQPEPTRLLLWAAAAGGSDPLGAFGPAVVLGFAMQPNLLRLGARLEATFPRSTPLLGSGGDVQSFSFTSSLEACLAPTLRPMQLSACVSGGVTVLEVTGQGTARDSHATVPLYGIGPSVGALWLLRENAFLSLDVASHFFLERPELVVEDLPQRRRIEPVSLSGQLGVGVRW